MNALIGSVIKLRSPFPDENTSKLIDNANF